MPTPTPISLAGFHLYALDGSSSGSVAQYNLPITGTSQPNFSFATEGSGHAIALNVNGDLALNGSTVAQIFQAPLSGASIPAATFASSSNGQPAYTQSGDIIFPSDGVLITFTHPFSNASIPSVITVPSMADGFGAVLDAAGNLYIASTGSDSQNNTVGNIFVFAPPYTGTPISTISVSGGVEYLDEAISPTQLFVSKKSGGIDVYALPITVSSQPQFSITTGVDRPIGLAVDPAGNLYATNLTNNSIIVFAPPFSAASTPATVLATNLHTLDGLAIGK